MDYITTINNEKKHYRFSFDSQTQDVKTALFRTKDEKPQHLNEAPCNCWMLLNTYYPNGSKKMSNKWMIFFICSKYDVFFYFYYFVDSKIFHASGGLHSSHEAGLGPTGAARRWQRKDMESTHSLA